MSLFDICNERKRDYLMATIIKEVYDVCDELFPKKLSRKQDDDGGKFQ